MRSTTRLVSRLLPLVALLLTASPGSAQEEAPDYARNGFYLGAGVVGTFYTEIEDELEDGLPPNQRISVDPALGFDAYAGYRLHRRFAVEAEFEMNPEVEVDELMAGSVTELEVFTATANAKGFLLTGRTQPFLLVGVGAMHAELDEDVGSAEDGTDLAVRFGGGLDFYLTEELVVSAGASYLLGTGDLDYLDQVSVGGGLQYRF